MFETLETPADSRRLEKARSIVSAGGVTQIEPDTWRVASQSGTGHHVVTRIGLNGDSALSCTCADWQGRNNTDAGVPIAACKHAIAVELLENGGVPEETPDSFEESVASDGEVSEEVEEKIQEVSSQLAADAVLWQITELEAAIEQVEDIAHQETSVIEIWKTAETGILQRRIGLMSAALEPFMRAQNRKTVRLPHGELRLRALQDKIEVDRDAFDFTREDLVRIIPEQREPDLKAIRANLKSTGEIPDGVEITPQAPKFSYKTLREEVKSKRKEVDADGRGHAQAAD